MILISDGINLYNAQYLLVIKKHVSDTFSVSFYFEQSIYVRFWFNSENDLNNAMTKIEDTFVNNKNTTISKDYLNASKVSTNN